MSGASTSVVIVSYRPGEWLEASIRSVVEQAGEVIVVDNGSDGQTASAIARRAGARPVRSAENLGFSGGVNLGVSEATGDLVALLNDDAEASANWLSAADAALADPSIAAVAPKVVLATPFREVVLPDESWQPAGDHRQLGRQLFSVRVGGRDVLDGLLGGVHRVESDGTKRWRWTEGPVPFYVPLTGATEATEATGVSESGVSGATGVSGVSGVSESGGSEEVVIDGEPAPPGPVCRLLNSAGTYLRDDGYAGDIGIGGPDDGRFDRPADHFGISGTALVVRRSTWERLGPLAGPYFAYYEDVDWCWRAQLAGLRLRYDPAATVVHRWSATSGGATDPRVRVLAESNRTLSLVRNAPLSVATSHLRQRWHDGPDGGVRRRAARLLPWAAASRARARMRTWSVTPDAVWEQWAGVGTEWDRSPAGRPASPAGGPVSPEGGPAL
jgi:GT2 family glycosyltransferase